MSEAKDKRLQARAKIEVREETMRKWQEAVFGR